MSFVAGHALDEPRPGLILRQVTLVEPQPTEAQDADPSRTVGGLVSR